MMIWNETDLDGRVTVREHHSELLEGNPLDDPHKRNIHVYLPPGYEETETKYPVLFVLSGFGGSSRKYLKDSTFVPGIHHQYESLLQQNRGSPAIMVFPDCKTSLGGSQYMNSPAVGPYRSYLIEEVLPFVQSEYRTIEEPSGCGIFGKSSGGYGALRLGMKHPETFGVIGCHAGDMMFKYCYMPDIPDAADAITEKGSKEAWLDEFRNRKMKGKNDFVVFNIIAMSACYSPDPDNPGSFDLPFDEETGEFREEVWNRWEQHDPVYMVEEHVDNLKELNYLYMNVGKNDEFHLQLGARILHDKLNELHVDHEYEEFDGGHMKTRAVYPDVLEELTSQFEQIT